jgi:hypothetical protein
MKTQARRAFVLWVGVVVVLGALALGRLAAATPPPKIVPPDPDAGLTDAQREAAYASGRAESAARYAKWLDDFIASGRSAADLPRADLMVADRAPASTLAAAKAAADLIVVGHVLSDEFTVDGTFVTFGIDRVATGTAPAPSVTIVMNGGPQPDPTISTGVLAVDDAAPVLLPGDTAMLFLELSKSTGNYEVQPTSGFYKIARGGVEAVEGNPFGGTLDGLVSMTPLG